MDLLSSAPFDRYVLLRPLGKPRAEGAPSRTFVALDTATAEEVVLQTSPGTQKDLRVFLQNYQSARTQTSAHLPTILAGGIQGQTAFLATPLILGVDLHDLGRESSVGHELGVQLLWRMALGLSSLHGNRLAHGDLHPHNVRVTASGRLLLVGYLPAPFNTPSRHLPEDAVVRRFEAPEVLEGEAPTPRADLYSLGLVSMELLTGRPLLPRADLARTREFQETLQASLPRVMELAGDIPRGVQSVIHDLLQTDPARRPRDASEVMERLLLALPRHGERPDFPTLLAQPFGAAARRTQRDLLRQARTQLDQGALESAPSLLREAASLTPQVGERDRERLLDQVRRAFWGGFFPPREGFDRRAYLYQGLRLAANQLEAPLLADLALIRQRELLPADSPLLLLLPETPSETLDSTPEEALRRLEQRPGNEDALLELAVRSPGFAPARGRPLAALKADLLRAHGLYRQALYHRVLDLFLEEDQEAVLRDIQGLTQEAFREVATPSAVLEFEAEAVSPLTASLLDESLSGVSPEHSLASDPPPPPAEREVEGKGEGEEDPEILFSRAQVAVHEGRFSRAAEIFEHLMARGLLEEERYYAAVCAELRKLMWRSLVPRPGQEPPFQALRQVWRLVRQLELTDLVPLGESLILTSLPTEARDTLLQELLEEAPRSISFLQASSTHALELGDRTTWARHLVTAGWEFVHMRDLSAASKVLMAARSEYQSPDLDRAMQAMFWVGNELAETSLRFRICLDSLSSNEVEALEHVEDFLVSYPHFQPAQEKALELADQLECPELVSHQAIELGKRALLREEHATARRHFRSILETQFENDEALLYLASMETDRDGLPDDLDLLRIEILRRHELFAAAIHHARRMLRGGAEDLPSLHLLIELCRESGADPSSHCLRAGLLELEGGDLEQAEGLIRQALESSRQPNQVLGVLAGTPGIEKILSLSELEKMLEEGQEDPESPH